MIPKSGYRSSEKIMRKKRSIAPETCKAVKPMLGFMLEFLVRPIAALA